MNDVKKKNASFNRCKRCRYWEEQSNRWGYCNQTAKIAPEVRFSYDEEEAVRIMTPRYAVCAYFEPLRPPRFDTQKAADMQDIFKEKDLEEF